MGAAMAQGWLNTMPQVVLTVVDPAAPAWPPSLALSSLKHCSALSQVPRPLVADAVVLAIKPQQMAEVAPHLQDMLPTPCPLILSIAAGITTTRLQGWMGEKSPIVRAMPNLPASVGAGISGAYAHACVTPPQRALAEQLLGVLGLVLWQDDEMLLEAVTAVSGSGPAYFFLLAEVMAEVGQALGLSAEQARTLARHTLVGAGALLRHDDRSVQALRQAVTSPGGTTEAALKVLMQHDQLKNLMHQAMQACVERARALGG